MSDHEESPTSKKSPDSPSHTSSPPKSPPNPETPPRTETPPKSHDSDDDRPASPPPPSYFTGRRRSSIIPPGGEAISLPKKRSGSKSPRRGSQVFLMGENIMMAFDGGRRLSSFCTTSSNEYVLMLDKINCNIKPILMTYFSDTAISMGDEPMTEEEIAETIKAHKQIISNMKTQIWPMHRKLKVS